MADLQETIYGFWETINDKSWPLLDALRIGDFFDEHNIPPVLFPIAIVLVAILLLLALGSGGPSGPDVRCGDGICHSLDNETYVNCPQDCPPPEGAGKQVKVRMNAMPSCELTVKLYSQDGELLNTQRGTKREFAFDGIDQDSAYAEIFGLSSQSQRTPGVSLGANEPVIQVTLGAGICESQQPQNGVLRLTVRDDSTGDPLNGVTVSISEVENGYEVNRPVSNAIVNGLRDFPLPHSKSYVINAEKDGYRPFDGSGEPIRVPSDTPASKAISLTPQPVTDPGTPGTPDTGDLEVCVTDDSAPVTSGMITVQGVSDSTFLIAGDLSDADPSMEPSGTGCLVFENLPAGKLVAVSMPNAPAGCIPIAQPSSIEILAARRQLIRLELECQPDDVAYLKVKVIDKNGRPITQNSTITVWTENADLIPGSGLANSLAMGSGDYTEEITVPTDESIYVWARGLPLGYLDHKTSLMELDSGEHRALTIDLNYTEPPATESLNFSFEGLSIPAHVPVDASFPVIVNKILFGETELTGTTATLEVTFSGSQCAVVYDGMWRANCTAPPTTGEANLIVSIDHEGKTASRSMPIEVRRYASGAGTIAVVPLFSTSEDPPMTLFYEILFNGEPISELAGQDLELQYLDSPSAHSGGLGELEWDGEFWTLEADVPFKGEYEIQMGLEIFDNGTFYTSTHRTTFSAKSHSSALSAEVYLNKDILEVSESFMVQVLLSFRNKAIEGLDILEMYMDGTFYTVPWDRARKLYILQLSAPSNELCVTLLDFIINGDKLEEQKTIHVLDTAKTKSAICPLDRQAACDSVEDVRKCVFDQNSRTSYYPEQQLRACIISGCPYAVLERCPTQNKGDLAMDCMLDEDDVMLAEEFMSIVSSQADRNKASECLDMDNDADVDADDLICLKNLAARKWHGDVGREGAVGSQGICPTPMNGGFCFDIDTDTPLPGDMVADGRINKEDEEIMKKVIGAVSAGVTPTEEILSAADFNQDGTVNSADMDCLKKFYVINFETGDIMSSSGTIPASCLAIFNLQCTGTRGDMNADGEVSEVDYVIVQLIANGQLTGYSNSTIECADVNDDGIVNEDDVLCMRAFLTGDRLNWLVCLDCEENMPPDAYGAEICADGLDNDCDGEIDPPELCSCNPNTPCDMKRDADGGTSPGVSDGNYMVCRDLSWDHTGYRWVSKGQLTCDQSRQCETIECDGSSKTCSGASTRSGKWYSGGLPEEICGDGWDNDCEGGDEACDIDDEDDGCGCLYVYSISDDGSSLDHLAYPFSVLPSWEEYSYGTMRSLSPASDGTLRLRLSEELPEISYVNNVRLLAVDHPSNVEVMPDADGNLHTLQDKRPVTSCVTEDGSDCTSLVESEGSGEYLLALEEVQKSELDDIYDELVLTFEKPESAKGAKIILRGRESGLITFIWWSMLERIGRNNMDEFLSGLEGDSLVSALFERAADQKAKVSIGVWDGSAWRYLASEYLAFSKHGNMGEILIPVNGLPHSRELKIKLVYAVGTFAIDYAAADYSDDLPLEATELELKSAIKSGRDVIALLGDNDDLHLNLVEGEQADLIFSDPPETPDLERTYVIGVSGHYTYDISAERELTDGTAAWVAKLLLDDEYLLDYALANYPRGKARFFSEVYN